MNNDDERDLAEEAYNEQLMRDFAELGFNEARDGVTRYQAKRWLSHSATYAQAREYWRGYALGEKRTSDERRRSQAIFAVYDDAKLSNWPT